MPIPRFEDFAIANTCQIDFKSEKEKKMSRDNCGVF
jgi:hypothetical protein